MNDTMVVERQESRQDVQPQRAAGAGPPGAATAASADDDPARRRARGRTGITLLADLPGVTRDALEIHVEGDR